MKKLMMVVAVFLVAGCTQPENAQRILEDQGYTSIEMHGHALFNCSRDDIYRDKFTAIGPAGRRVSGVVCAGLLFKGSTIRLD